MISFAFVIIGVLIRLVPHLPNFAPISAIAIFAGANLKKRTALIVPILTMFLSDYLLLYINPYSSNPLNFHILYSPLAILYPGIGFVWGSFILSGLIGISLRGRQKPQYILLASLLASVQFFLITNFGVWMSGMYARGLNGILESYLMGLPFFRWTLLGDLFYTVSFFGLYNFANLSESRLLRHYIPRNDVRRV